MASKRMFLAIMNATIRIEPFKASHDVTNFRIDYLFIL